MKTAIIQSTNKRDIVCCVCEYKRTREQKIENNINNNNREKKEKKIQLVEKKRSPQTNKQKGEKRFFVCTGLDQKIGDK